jgi:hypothetical protein
VIQTVAPRACKMGYTTPSCQIIGCKYALLIIKSLKTKKYMLGCFVSTGFSQNKKSTLAYNRDNCYNIR